ncbi:MAG TPA: membrane protein insertase YidC [Gemmatimonadales bacterium]|jgi:YidC/Oxa1 family membrane protein insertase
MDRKLLLGLALIFAIFTIPTLLMKKQAPIRSAALADSLRTDSINAATHDSTPPAAVPAAASVIDTATVTGPDHLVVIRSKLYRFAVSTHGGRIVSTHLLTYLSLAETPHDTLELVAQGDALLGGTLVAGNDTIRLDQVQFTASADSLSAVNGPATLTLHGVSGSHAIDLNYTFAPTQYRVDVSGQVTGLGPTGATFFVNLGHGFRNTESNGADNNAQSAVVTKFEKSQLTAFGKLKPHETRTMPGPFEWVAVKSKYFVASLFAYDSTAQGVTGKVTALQATMVDTTKGALRVQVVASLAVPTAGTFGWSMYVGPMEYNRLHSMGRDFDDVNPYGWSWLRWLIRPIAVWIRAIFVWMHETLGLGYGLVIVLFGLTVRILLWPLNRVAMRSMARMQAVQPEITALQDRFKDNPQQLQQETFKLYKEHNVNPFGGCWPMLLPYPLLVAVFFVLAYTIEVRGVHFLWMTDLARPDSLYIIPLLMAGSMYVVSRIGQMGLPPNPQTKMMTWMMPIMMLFLFARFAAGLNLYYTIQNLTSIPQQWLVMQERLKAKGKPVVGVRKK